MGYAGRIDIERPCGPGYSQQLYQTWSVILRFPLVVRAASVRKAECPPMKLLVQKLLVQEWK